MNRVVMVETVFYAVRMEGELYVNRRLFPQRARRDET